jgi:hypothetical protein
MTSRGEDMTWHIDAELFGAYARGALTPSRVMAVDAHVQACSACRAAVPADEAGLDRSWLAIADTLAAGRPSPVERLLGRAGLPEHRVRLLAATPALRRSYFAATTAVLAFAVLAAHTGQTGARTTLMLFLVFAPILPVLAVATAYGPPADSMHEITSATPMAGPSLVLWRATAVVVPSMGMGVIAAAASHGPGWWAAAWLLPAFLLCTGTLALATVMPLATAAGLLGGAWLLTTLAVGATVPPVQVVLFGPVAQVGYLTAAVVAVAVLALRRRHLDPGESR